MNNKEDKKFIVGVTALVLIFCLGFFLVFDSISEGFSTRNTLYSGTVVSDSATNGIVHIVLSNSTGNWDVNCDIAYRGSVSPTTWIFHYKVVVPSAPATVLGLHVGQNVTIDSGYYGCRVS